MNQGLAYFQSSSASFQLWVDKSDLDCMCFVNKFSIFNYFSLKKERFQFFGGDGFLYQGTNKCVFEDLNVKLKILKLFRSCYFV